MEQVRLYSPERRRCGRRECGDGAVGEGGKVRTPRCRSAKNLEQPGHAYYDDRLGTPKPKRKCGGSSGFGKRAKNWLAPGNLKLRPESQHLAVVYFGILEPAGSGRRSEPLLLARGGGGGGGRLAIREKAHAAKKSPGKRSSAGTKNKSQRASRQILESSSRAPGRYPEGGGSRYIGVPSRSGRKRHVGDRRIPKNGHRR